MAAGSVIVEEAGGLALDMDGGGDFLTTGHLLCGPAGVVEELLEIVQHHRSQWAEIEANLDD